MHKHMYILTACFMAGSKLVHEMKKIFNVPATGTHMKQIEAEKIRRIELIDAYEDRMREIFTDTSRTPLEILTIWRDESMFLDIAINEPMV